MDKTNLPVEVPKLLRVKSTVEVCASCGKWACRYPDFVGNEGFWECERCGCTSVKIRDGRPYGPKSKDWGLVKSWFEEFFPDITPEDFDTIETEPPLKSLDWQSIERWFKDQGIYRVFMGVTLNAVHDVE